jgi:hypothetical protein
VIVRVDEDGKHLSTVRVPNEPAEVARAIEAAGPNLEIVLAAAFGYYSLVDLPEEPGTTIQRIIAVRGGVKTIGASAESAGDTSRYQALFPPVGPGGKLHSLSSTRSEVPHGNTGCNPHRDVDGSGQGAKSSDWKHSAYRARNPGRRSHLYLRTDRWRS